MPTQTQPAAGAQATQLIEIGEVAARNIVARLKLDAGKSETEAQTVVASVKKAISDEINTMSSHFTLAIADVQTQYEAEIAKVKSEYQTAVADIRSGWNYVKGKPWIVAAALGVTFAVGVLAGLVL